LQTAKDDLKQVLHAIKVKHSFGPFIPAHADSAKSDAAQADTLGAKLSREGELFASAPVRAIEAAKAHIKNDQGVLVTDATIGIAAGLTIGALAKNPGLFGKAASGAVRAGLEQSGKVFGVVAAADWSVRLSAPAIATWNDKAAAESACHPERSHS